ncbi:hypothetical protein GCM10009759_75250 [Kitasatospora saccharophila]|uniref:WXG100 family type VII secretion target n=2 Tax=Kitasatospora saccharophila TaxID=407973 RepID=A0ABN2YA95_9ACTN
MTPKPKKKADTGGGRGGSTSGRQPTVEDPRKLMAQQRTSTPPAPAGHGAGGSTPTVGRPENIRPTAGQGTATTRQTATAPASEPEGEEPAGVDRRTWFGGGLVQGAKDTAAEGAKNFVTSAAGNFGSKAGDWAGDRVFGSSEGGEGEPEEPVAHFGAAAVEAARSAVQPGADGGAAGPEGWSTQPAYVSPGGGYGVPVTQPGRLGGPAGGMPAGRSDAYAWAQKQVEEKIQQLEEAQHKSRSGLSGAIDGLVVKALEESGLLDALEKVTGKLDELNYATMEWQAQAGAVRSVAAELRAGVMPVAETWSGSASDAFGGHMGDVADALDQTAEEMMQTAQIINSAAQECEVAEGMVIDIITEAIESLIVSLAAEAVLTVVTFGAAAVVGAILDEAEIGVFIARVAQVSTKLAKALEELLKALQEMGKAVKAARKLGDIAKVMEKMKKVESTFNRLRTLEQDGTKAAKIAQKVTDKAAQKAESWAQGQVEDWMGMDKGDRDGVQIGDNTVKGNLKAAGQTAAGVAKEAWHDGTNQNAIKQEFLNDVGLDQEPEPYRVDRSRIQTAFG